MGRVKKRAEEVQRGLAGALPKLRKTVLKKLALAVGAMIEGQTPNTVELANPLPLKTDRQDMREQWLRRLLKIPLGQLAGGPRPWGQNDHRRVGARRDGALPAGGAAVRAGSHDELGHPQVLNKNESKRDC